MKLPGILLLVIGCVWMLFLIWMFLAIASIAEFVWSLSDVLYWVGMLIGPVSLIIGSCLVLIRGKGRSGAILVAIGCVTLTVYVLYNTVAGMQRQPLQITPPYSSFIVMIIIVLSGDIAGFKVVRRLLFSNVAAQ